MRSVNSKVHLMVIQALSKRICFYKSRIFEFTDMKLALVGFITQVLFSEIKNFTASILLVPEAAAVL